MRFARRLLIHCLFACCGLVSIAYAGSEPLVVFAAASTKGALDDCLRDFERASGVRVVASYSASSTVARQIANGAPADVVISANTQWIKFMSDAQLLKPGSVRTLTTNRLVLVASPTARVPTNLLPVRQQMPILAALGESERFAIGDPAHVPAGLYAAQALRSLGVWNQVRPRIVPAANVRLALALIARNEVPLGIVYASDVVAQSNVQALATIPSTMHDSIVYPIAITASSRHAQSDALLGYLVSEHARDTFKRHGFGG